MSSTPSLDGILSITVETGDVLHRGSGVVLASGLYALTVAHLFADYQAGDSVEITSVNGLSYEFEQVTVHHDWQYNSADFNFDIAVVKLTPAIPVEGFNIWAGGDYQHEMFTLLGINSDGDFHTGTNTFDADGSVFNDTHNLGNIAGTQLLYDFDNGQEEQNSLLNFFNLPSSSIPTDNETLAQLGDSGGPLLIDNQIVALSSYVFRPADYDVNDFADSSAGEIGGATYVAPYIPWIESIIGAHSEVVVPQLAGDVLTEIAEPFSGEVVNYFLLEMFQPKIGTVSLYYTTRAGTATEGEDYKASQGWVNIAPGETHIAIAITIYGDIEPEDDETLSLVVTDPSGQWMSSEIKLVATHTILDNSLI
jgi:hypothetical protein